MSSINSKKSHAYSNIVKGKKLREIQKWTLHSLADAILPSVGPYGSTTQILRGNPANPNQTIETEYTKDGHTILSRVKYDRALEDSIQKECVDITRYIVKTVGDGTSSVIAMSSYIFDELCKIEDENYPPFLILEKFHEICESLKKSISSRAHTMNIDDVFKISMICTNQNKEISDIIADIYKQHGTSVYINVGTSNTEDTIIKSYDGLTLEVGYSDPVYINRKPDGNNESVGMCIIRNARIYTFLDPIDTREMATFFNKIVLDNIMKPMDNYRKTGDVEYLKQVVPTVIMAPKITVDMNEAFGEIDQYMYQFNEHLDTKPPLLIITNISMVNFEIYSDIWRMCGARPIKKYIDPEIQNQDIADGKAPTIDTICDWCGYAQEVEADAFKTTFINPRDMFARDEEGKILFDDNDEPIYSETYRGQLAFLEQELKVAERDQSYDTIGNLKRRINSLKANMVDLLIGGVATTDRDSVKALAEDAVLNIRSASQYGVGYGANFEGLKAITDYINHNFRKYEEGKEPYDYEEILKYSLAKAIRNGYRSMVGYLYSSSAVLKTCGDLSLEGLIDESIKADCPLNLITHKYDAKVLCTIRQDIEILDVISKIISIMFTTNQSLVQGPQYNMYIDIDE